MGLVDWLKNNLRDDRPMKVAEPTGAKQLDLDGYPLDDFTEYPTVQLSGENRIMSLDGIGYDYARIYASQQNVRTVIDFIARQAAGLTLKMYEKVPRADGKPADRLELADHPLAIMLGDPTPGESDYDFYYAMLADFCIYDEYKAFLIRPTAGAPPSALVRIPPPNLIPDRDPVTGKVLRWRTLRGQPVPMENVMWFNGYDPKTNRGSIPPMETLRRLLNEEIQRDNAQMSFWGRGLRKEGVIEQDVDAERMPDTALESFMVDAEDALGGVHNSYRPFVLQPGMKWRDINWNPNQLQYIEARRVSRQEACAMFHVPPALVAAAENGKQPDENSLRVFYQATLPPYLERIEANVKAKLIPMFTLNTNVRRAQYVKFNLDEKLRGSFEEKAAIMMSLAGGPVVSVNEGRSRLDLPETGNPLDDEIYQPSNSTRGGGPQASPQNPVDTPARGLNPAGTTPGGGTNPEKSVQDMIADFEHRLESERKRAALQARVEERTRSVIEHHFERQKSAQSKKFDEDRWTRELEEDLTSALLTFSLDVKSDQVQTLLHSFALDVNTETEKHRENGAFNPERAAQAASKLAPELLDALKSEGADQEKDR
jgi:HK97 family phage portal protein